MYWNNMNAVTAENVCTYVPYGVPTNFQSRLSCPNNEIYFKYYIILEMSCVLFFIIHVL